LTLPAQAILSQLSGHISRGGVVPGNPETFLSYGDVHQALNLPMRRATIGMSLQAQGLEDLALWTKNEKHPAITGLIVDKSHDENPLQPGKGYFKLFGKKYPDDIQWWINQIKLSLNYNWNQFLDGNEANDADETEIPSFTHICIGDPARHDLELIEQAAAKNNNVLDWWNISRFAAPGDRVIFYVKAPVSAFVACGVVGRRVTQEDDIDRSSRWYDEYCFWINDPQMLPNRLTLQNAKELFPMWSFLGRPQPMSIPNDNTPAEFVEKFLTLLQLPPLRQTQTASDLWEPPARTPTTTYRILRDTQKALKIKIMYEYKCQICEHTIKLPNGDFYAEAHHIQPLGGPHPGPDVMENIMCVCPNHHAEMDYGVRPIDLTCLRILKHKINPEYIDYHNREIFKASQQPTDILQ
jgi:hypothetical protein